MQVGYNHNIKHKGKEYHIQTEDSGKTSMMITTLLYSEGTIISSKKENYSEIVEQENYEEQLKELMQKQHKQMLTDLKNGTFDDSELAKLEEPEDVKAVEDQTISEAIDATGVKDSEGAIPEPPKEPLEKTVDDSQGNEDVDRNSSDLVEEIMNCLQSTLETLTQKGVEINKENEELLSLEKVSLRFEENILVSQTRLSKDLKAECAFVNDLKCASSMTDLILLGEGTPKDELTEDDLDAMKEAMNQTFGLVVQKAADNYGKTTTYDQVKLSAINAKEQKEELKKLFDEDKVFAFTYSIKIEEILNSNIYFYITSGIKNYLDGVEKKVQDKDKAAHIIREEDTEVVKAEDEVEMFGAVGEMGENQEERELRNVELIKGIEVDAKIKLGETVMPLKKIAKLAPGTIIELNKDVESLLELVINDKTIAEGVLVVVSTNNFALRITSILDQTSRIKKLGSNISDY